MSRELFYQSLILKVVKGMGGQGFKLANKFKSGVPDLLIKLPGQLALMAEIKYDTLPKGSLARSEARIRLTPLQEKFLRDYAKVDMDVAAIQVAEDGNDFFFAITPPGYFLVDDGEDFPEYHYIKWNGQSKKRAREEVIRHALMERE